MSRIGKQPVVIPAGVDVTIDGQVIKADRRRTTGVHANAAMWVDPHLRNTCMIDKVGGSVSFYDTKVNLLKVEYM